MHNKCLYPKQKAFANTKILNHPSYGIELLNVNNIFLLLQSCWCAQRAARGEYIRKQVAANCLIAAMSINVKTRNTKHNRNISTSMAKHEPMGGLLHHTACAHYWWCSSPSGQVCSCPAGRQQSQRQSPVHRSFTLGSVPALPAARCTTCKTCKGDGGGRLEGYLRSQNWRIQQSGFEKLD